ncbi:FecR domain-containing protein [Planctomycetota bacterium]
MKQQEFLNLTQKYIEGSLTENESDALYNGLKTDPSLQQDFTRLTSQHGILEKAFSMANESKGTFAEEVMDRLEKDTSVSTRFSREIIERIHRRKRKSRRNVFALWVSFAAMVIIAAGIYLFVIQNIPIGTVYTQGNAARLIKKGDIINAEQGSLYIELNDGSRIDLKKGTALVCSSESDFLLKEGSIYCSIKPQQKDSPFVIKDPYEHTAVVKGTEFEMETGSGQTAVKVEGGAVLFSGTEIKALNKGILDHAKGTVAVSPVFLCEIAHWKFKDLPDKDGFLFRDTCDSLNDTRWKVLKGKLSISEREGIDKSRCFMFEPDKKNKRFIHLLKIDPFRFKKIVFDIKYRIPPYDNQNIGMVVWGSNFKMPNYGALVKKEDVHNHIPNPPYLDLYRSRTDNHPYKFSMARFYIDMEKKILIHSIFTSDSKLSSWHLYKDERPMRFVTFRFTGSKGKWYLDDITCYVPDETFDIYKK